ncbi:hypothetical protein IWX47DRAFT_863514 [Phyllosticta citricarpa]
MRGLENTISFAPLALFVHALNPARSVHLSKHFANQKFLTAPYHRDSNISSLEAYFFATFVSTLHDLAHRRKNSKPCHISTTLECLPAAFFFFPYEIDELREAIDVIYAPITQMATAEESGEDQLEEGCAARYRRVVEKDEASKLWSAASVPQTSGGEHEEGDDASRGEEEERDELKI